MQRSWFTLGIVATVALAASAQGPTAGKSAAEQLRLFRAHRPLLDQLLDQTLRLAEAGDALDRAERCHDAATALAGALSAAATAPDADPSRVAELSGLLASVIRDGLVPALEQAATDHRKGSDGYPQLIDLRGRAGVGLAKARDFPVAGMAARSKQVQAARTELDAAVRTLPPAE